MAERGQGSRPIIRSRQSLPTAACRVRSWCKRWLSVAPRVGSIASFVENANSSCAIVLWPVAHSLYKLQVLFQASTGSSAISESPAALSCAAGQEATAVSVPISAQRWFLCTEGRVVSLTWCTLDSQSDHTLFALEFSETGRVRVRGGLENGYLTTDEKGRLWSGTKIARKWEYFTLLEEALEPYSTLAVQGPVRVTLKANSGKYLCASMPTVCARAEAPCCCEELLFDLKFPALLIVRQQPASDASKDGYQRVNIDEEILHVSGTTKSTGISGSCLLPSASYCSIRTGDGSRVLGAESDGMVVTARLDQVRGMEFFTMELEQCEKVSKVSIRPCFEKMHRDRRLRRYMSAEASGRLLCNSFQVRKQEQFCFELANGSRVLIRSVQGGCLAADPDAIEEDSSPVYGRTSTPGDTRPKRKLCSCVPRTRKEVEDVGAWQLRSHGDSLYTLVAVPTPKGGADVYLFADSSGGIYQSNEPAVHFPAVASQFEIRPVSASILQGSACVPGEGCVADKSIAGFTIQTVRRINGKRRFLSVEPSGRICTSLIFPSRWAIFYLIDVDAAAATAVPEKFICQPAAMNSATPTFQTTVLTSARARPANVVAEQSVHEPTLRSPASGGSQGTDGVTATSAASTAAENLQRAAGVAAYAFELGQAVPKRAPASLQDLCCLYVCLNVSEEGPASSQQEQLFHLRHALNGRSSDFSALPAASREFMELISVLRIMAKTGNVSSSSSLHSLIAENNFSLPDDLLFKVWSLWRLRQHPQQSCKWWASSTPTAYQNGVHGRNRRGFGQGFPPRRLHVVQESVEGWHCGSCNNEGVLSMDPMVNPAHHRYLEVQYHAFSRANHSSGLWNAISFIGISIMTTAFFFQAKAAAVRRTGRA